MYNANQDTLEGFSMQKARGAGPVSVLFTAYAFNESTGAAEGYMEFQEQIWNNNLIDRFEELGFTSVDIVTFQNNDGNQSAASAFHHVVKVSASPGFKLICTGEINPKVSAKAKEIQEKEKAGVSTSEFDVKTQAAIKQSLAEISEAMVTKDDLYSLGESSHKGFEEIKERMKSDHEQIKLMKMIYVSNAHQANNTADIDSASSLYHDYVSLQFYHLGRAGAQRDTARTAPGEHHRLVAKTLARESVHLQLRAPSPYRQTLVPEPVH